MKKLLVRVFWLFFIGILALIIYGFFILPIHWKSSTRKESIALLRAAKTTNELQAAVGSYGLFIPLTNNQWVAIRYRDSHTLGMKSVSVAVDSGGLWFESDVHHCGTFRAWANNKKLLTLSDQENTNSTPNNMSQTDRTLQLIESAQDIETARTNLLQLGFRPLEN